LKADIAITTKKKNEMMAKKRNLLEGTSSNAFMFSELPVDPIKNLSADMGIAVDNISFGTFDMLRDLEIARNNLHTKNHKPSSVDHIEDTLEENDMLERLIEWLQDELAHSKKVGKLSKRKLKISPKNIKKKTSRGRSWLEQRGK
jgi:hypothetical protein